MTQTSPPIPFQKISSTDVLRLMGEIKSKLPELVASQGEAQPLRWKVTQVHSTPSFRVFVGLTTQAKPGEYLVNFGLNSGVYFLKCKLTASPEGSYLDFSGDIYKIQRRDNFRCPVPSSIHTSVKVYESKEAAAPLPGEFRFKDLSGQGLALYLPNPTDLSLWQSAQVFYVDFEILGQSFQGLEMIIRHLHQEESQPWVGAELLGLSFSQETDLSSVVLELQRHWFRNQKAV